MSDIIRISELTAGTPPYGGTTLFEISVDAGAGSWLTRRAAMSDIKATVGDNLTLTGNTTLSGFTAGSVLFVGASGVVSQDNANLFWNDSTNQLLAASLALTTALPITSGGTGATTAAAALLALGGAPLNAPVFTGDARAVTPLTADNDTSIATTAFVKAQGYLTGNQTITITGDADGSGTTAITLTLDSVAANVGTFQGLTVNAKGLVTAAVNQNYAPLASPLFTGDPRSVTPLTADNSVSIATTAFVKAQGYVTGNQTITLSGDATGSGTTAIPLTLATVATPGTFQGITFNAKGLVTSATNMAYAPLAGPTFTGVPAAPTATAGTSTTQLATTAFVATSYATIASLAAYAPLASPVFTGNPTAPTPTAGDNDTSIATTAFVATSFAPLASPIFTGDPRAPTPLTADNDTSVATTAFVKAQNYITGNQTITVTGDVDGSGTTAITLTLDTVNANVGTFQGLTVNAKGLVTAATNMSYATVASLAGYLPIAGGTLTGNLTVAPATGGATETINAATLNVALTVYQNVGSTRWRIGKNATAETTGAGSNFVIQRHDDAGAFIDNALLIERLTGNIAIGTIAGTTIPQATLHIGPVATARSYNGYTDASNGTWAYMGDWGKTANIASYGTDFNGTGVARGVDILVAGALGMRINSVGSFGFGAAPLSSFDIAGDTTTNTVLRCRTTQSTAITATVYGLFLDPVVTLSGATTNIYYGLWYSGSLTGPTTTLNFYIGAASKLQLDTGFTGTVVAGYAFYANAPTITSPAKPITTYTAYYVVGAGGNGDGLTVGGVTNRGLHVAALASGSSGGTVTNEAIRLVVPTGGPTSGTTSNYGLYITGNGGSLTGGVLNNWAIYNDSTADVNLSAGKVGIKTGGLAPQADLHVGATAGTARVYNVFASVTNTEFSYIGDWGLTANVASFGTGKLGTGLARDVHFVRDGAQQLRLTASGVTSPVAFWLTANTNTLVLSSATAAQQSNILWQDVGASKWQMGKQTDNSFFLYDVVNNATPFQVTTIGTVTLGESQQIQMSKTGVPISVTPLTADNSQQIATTAFVKAQGYVTGNQTITITGDVDGSGTTAITLTLDTVNANVGTFQGITVNAKGLVTAAVNQSYAPLNAPVFTGDARAVTPSIGDSDTSIATTAFVATSFATIASLSAYAPLVSPGFSGTPTAPTAAPGVNSGQIATTAFVATAAGAYLPLVGGALTGGLGFGAALAASTTDLSRHIALFSTSYGFNITSNRLNYVVAASGSHKFVVNALDVGTVSSAGGAFTAMSVDSASTAAKLTIGTASGAPGTARIYSSYIDAANGSWAYLGDWSKTAGVATYGTDNIGSGAIGNIQFMVGGVRKLDYGVATAGLWTLVDGITIPLNGRLYLGDTTNIVIGSLGGARQQITSVGNEIELVLSQFSADTIASVLAMGKSRGTTAVPAAVVSGDDIASIRFAADDGQLPAGSLNVIGARQQITVDGAVSAGVVPMRFTWETRSVSPGTLGERMRLHASGGLSLGNTTDPGSTNALITGNIMLAGTTSAFPMLKRNGITLELRLGDDTAFAPLSASYLMVGGVASPIVAESAGDIISGVSTGRFQFDASLASTYIQRSDATVSGAWLFARKSRGDTTTPTAVVSADDLFLIRAYGYDGNSFEEAGRISFDAIGTIADGIVPGRIVFYTASTAGVLTARLFINEAGLFQFGANNATVPALKRVTTTLQVRLGDDTGYATLDALAILDSSTPPTGTAGSGYVRATSPVLVTPNLGTPSTLVLTNATGLPIAGIAALGAGVATWMATPSSANLAAAVTGETGSGALVFGTGPTLSAIPSLGIRDTSAAFDVLLAATSTPTVLTANRALNFNMNNVAHTLNLGTVAGTTNFPNAGAYTLAALDVAGTWTATQTGMTISGAVLTGVPTAPTAGAGTNTTQVATTAFVQSEIATDLASYLPLAGGALTGGLGFGGVVAPGGSTDLSRHISLHTSGYGFNVTSGTLNYVVGNVGAHNFVIGTVNALNIGPNTAAYLFDMSAATQTSAITGTIIAMNFAPVITPTHATALTALYGISADSHVTGTSALLITSYNQVNSQINIDAGFTAGSISHARSFFSANINNLSTRPGVVANFGGFYQSTITNGQGLTAGTVFNRAFYVNGITAGTAIGTGTINNYGLQIAVMPSGIAAGGIVNNYGIYIDGPGGTASGSGVVNNFVLFSGSSAPMQIAGTFQFGGSTASFPMLQRSGAGLQVMKADGSAFADLTADRVLVRDTAAAFSTIMNSTSAPVLTANRTLTFDMGNVAHTLDFGATANTITFPSAATVSLAALDLAGQTGNYIYFAGGTGAVNTTGGPLIYIDATNHVYKQGVNNGAWWFQNYAGAIVASISAAGGLSVSQVDGTLKFSGTTASFPALKRSTTELQCRLADDSAYGPMSASILSQVGNEQGASVQFRSLTELTTIAAGTTTTNTTIQIPINAVVLAVSVRVVTVIPTAATFSVGPVGNVTRYGSGILTAANTTSPGTLAGPIYYAAAVAISLVMNANPATATGQVRVTIHYYVVGVPSS